MIRVKFLGGTPFLRRRVRKIAPEWFRHCNLKLVFVTKGPAEVRIDFQPGGRGALLGRESLTHSLDPVTLKSYASNSGITLNFGGLTDKSPSVEIRGLILHEFGHVLGLVHEHQHPGAGIAWQRDSVYAYYARLGWSREAVDEDVLNPQISVGTHYMAYDRLSIMHYPIPPELLTDSSQVVAWPDKLSASDIAFVRSAYPSSSSVIVSQ